MNRRANKKASQDDPKPDVVPCQFCGALTRMTGTKMCDPCWEVVSRISVFLKTPAAREYVRRAIAASEASS